MQNKIFDLIILGAGPAGITAAVYAARKKIDFLVISKDIGGQAAWSGDVENYTGYQFVTGPELVLKFQNHMDSFGIDLKMPEEIKAVTKNNNLITVATDKSEYITKAVVIATGKKPKPLGVPGEEEFRNKGVNFCATCDGPLFRSKNVAVIGGGNSALDAVLQMMKISPKVYVINSAPFLTGDSVMMSKAIAASNVEIWNNSKVKKIYGEKFVKGIEVTKDNKTYNFNVEGVFVEIGLLPNSDFVYAPVSSDSGVIQNSALIKLNELKEIVVDCYNRTNIDGIFACGDVTNVPEKQIIIACGEGAKASLAAFNYLSTHILP